MNSFGVEKAVTIRYPSTANLLVDSADRPSPDSTTPYDFQITRPQALLNGFFSRAGVTEVVLEWCQDNVTTANNSITFDLSGIAPNNYAGFQTVSINPGLYTAAEALDALVVALNARTPTTGMTFAIDQVNPPDGTLYTLTADDGYYTVSGSQLAQQLGIAFDESIAITATSTGVLLGCIDLRPYRYIDFVSSQLTYPQDLKDSSTQAITRDILCRWYFAEDNEESVDQYGFPILMGYRRFCRRRIFNPPKQIKWDSNLPVGNLSFQVYSPSGTILTTPVDVDKNNYLMTLQLSEN